MELTGERYIPGLKGQIELEHFNRYFFAINQFKLSDKIVLDLASGEGYGTDLLARYSRFVFGIDNSQEAIGHAKSKYTRQNINFLLGSADNIPLANNSIDVCVSFETIEHHEEHKEMIHEIKRVLKKDGYLIISSPDKLHYSDLPNYRNPYHVKELYVQEFKTLIRNYFINVSFFNQCVFNGSLIFLDDTYKKYKKPVVCNNDGNLTPLAPLFNIAIATDNNSSELNHLLFFYENDEPSFSKIYVEQECEKAQKLVYNSWSYRFGYFFINPLKRMLRLFNLNK